MKKQNQSPRFWLLLFAEISHPKVVLDLVLFDGFSLLAANTKINNHFEGVYAFNLSTTIISFA